MAEPQQLGPPGGLSEGSADGLSVSIINTISLNHDVIQFYSSKLE